MQQLGKREEQLMQIIWQLEKAFIKEIIEEIPEPKPHYNTVATMVKILVKKGFLVSEKLGNSYRFSPKVSLTDYRKEELSGIKEKYFDKSFSNMITYFAEEEKLSKKDIADLMKIINSDKKNKK